MAVKETKMQHIKLLLQEGAFQNSARKSQKYHVISSINNQNDKITFLWLQKTKTRNMVNIGIFLVCLTRIKKRHKEGKRRGKILGVVFHWHERGEQGASPARAAEKGMSSKGGTLTPNEMLTSLSTTLSPFICQHNGHLDDFCEVPL